MKICIFLQTVFGHLNSFQSISLLHHEYHINLTFVVICNGSQYQKAYMITEDGLSSEIHINRGVRQCCVLSPCLFNLDTENIFGAINTNKGTPIGCRTINNLRYADDTVLLAKDEDLQEILNEVNRIGKTFHM